jgi:Skp family chaperone for outer membrane proteins
MKLRNAVVQILMLSVAVMIGAALPLDAQSPAAGRIVVVDGERVTLETRIGQETRQRVTAAAEDWQARLTAGQQELQALAQNRQTQALTLSQAALSQLDRDIEEKQVALQRMQDDAQRQMERLQVESQQAINELLIPVLESMAAEQGYDFVFDARMVETGTMLYYANRLDVTADYVARVDAASAGSN